MTNTLNNEIALLDTMRETILQARKGISKSRRLRLAKKKQVVNLRTRIRRELDSAPLQTIISNGLFIDYDPNYKNARFKKYFPDEINEPFNINYTKPDKLTMSQYADEDAKVIYLNEHVATLEYTKYIVEDISKDEKDKDKDKGTGTINSAQGLDDALSDLLPTDTLEIDYYGWAFLGDGSQWWLSTRFPSAKWKQMYGENFKVIDGVKRYYFTVAEAVALYGSSGPGLEGVKINPRNQGAQRYDSAYGQKRIQAYWTHQERININGIQSWVTYRAYKKTISYKVWLEEQEDDEHYLLNQTARSVKSSDTGEVTIGVPIVNIKAKRDDKDLFETKFGEGIYNQ